MANKPAPARFETPIFSSAARSMANANYAYTGSSAHRVPSLSETAPRSTSGTAASDSGSVTPATKSTIDRPSPGVAAVTWSDTGCGILCSERRPQSGELPERS